MHTDQPVLSLGTEGEKKVPPVGQEVGGGKHRWRFLYRRNAGEGGGGMQGQLGHRKSGKVHTKINLNTEITLLNKSSSNLNRKLKDPERILPVWQLCSLSSGRVVI